MQCELYEYKSALKESCHTRGKSLVSTHLWCWETNINVSEELNNCITALLPALLTSAAFSSSHEIRAAHRGAVFTIIYTRPSTIQVNTPQWSVCAQQECFCKTALWQTECYAGKVVNELMASFRGRICEGASSLLRSYEATQRKIVVKCQFDSINRCRANYWYEKLKNTLTFPFSWKVNKT